MALVLILIFRGGDRELTITWDGSSGATYYEVQITVIDPASATQQAIITTKKTSVKVRKPKAGYFKVKVRACNNVGCSEWTDSIDYRTK